jgi:tRNA(Met) cytidine acetyltransferase
MRIAVHPDLHSQGIGSEMLSKLLEFNQYEYYSTSFGATVELIHFWQKNGFASLKLGSHKDQASGTYSVIMVRGQHGWIDEAQQHFRDAFCYGVSTIWSDMDTCLIRALLNTLTPLGSITIPLRLLKSYAEGGTNFDSIAAILDKWWQAEISLIMRVEDLFIRRVVQRKSWSECAREFGLSGKKQTEKAFREQLGILLKSY